MHCNKTNTLTLLTIKENMFFLLKINITKYCKETTFICALLQINRLITLKLYILMFVFYLFKKANYSNVKNV